MLRSTDFVKTDKGFLLNSGASLSSVIYNVQECIDECIDSYIVFECKDIVSHEDRKSDFGSANEEFLLLTLGTIEAEAGGGGAYFTFGFSRTYGTTGTVVTS